jgi:PqqD family protein of HPr-rel-A system
MAGRKWRLEPLTVLHWRHFDGEWVVFEAASGDTHRVDPVSAAILMCLEAEPQDLNGLSGAIAAELNVTDVDDLARRIEELVGQLTTLGLVESLAP